MHSKSRMKMNGKKQEVDSAVHRSWHHYIDLCRLHAAHKSLLLCHHFNDFELCHQSSADRVIIEKVSFNSRSRGRRVAAEMSPFNSIKSEITSEWGAQAEPGGCVIDICSQLPFSRVEHKLPLDSREALLAIIASKRDLKWRWKKNRRASRAIKKRIAGCNLFTHVYFIIEMQRGKTCGTEREIADWTSRQMGERVEWWVVGRVNKIFYDYCGASWWLLRVISLRVYVIVRT